jgi:hypothetical protein
MPVQQMYQLKKKIKEVHGRTYLEEWIYVGLYSVDLHGEAHCTREEVLRQRVEDYDADAGGSGYVERLSRGTIRQRMYG